MINTTDSCAHSPNRLIPFFLKTDVLLKPKEERSFPFEASFIDQLSGVGMVNLIDLKTGTNAVKVNVIGMLDSYI